jgi:hypothetical protein
MEVGETNTAHDLDHFYPHLYPHFFKLVECEHNGMTIRVGDKISDLTITGIDNDKGLVFLDNGNFMYYGDLPTYYMVIDWKIVPAYAVGKCQYSSSSIKDAKEFVLYNCPCLTIDEVLHVAVDDPFDSYLSDELKKIVQKKLDAHTA